MEEVVRREIEGLGGVIGEGRVLVGMEDGKFFWEGRI